MSAQHTPGPWQFVTQTDWPHTQIVHVTAENWGVIANLRLDPSMPHLVERQQANLHLIAAAPELLSVVQEMFSLEAQLLGDIYGSEFVARAQAAIAKAKGETA